MDSLLSISGCSIILLSFIVDWTFGAAYASLPLAFASLIAWGYLGWFLLGFKSTGPFIIMIAHSELTSRMIFLSGFESVFFCSDQRRPDSVCNARGHIHSRCNAGFLPLAGIVLLCCIQNNLRSTHWQCLSCRAIKGFEGFLDQMYGLFMTMISGDQPEVDEGNNMFAQHVLSTVRLRVISQIQLFALPSGITPIYSGLRCNCLHPSL